MKSIILEKFAQNRKPSAVLKVYLHNRESSLESLLILLIYWVDQNKINTIINF